MFSWRSIENFIVSTTLQKTGTIAAEMTTLGFSHPYAPWNTITPCLSLSQISPQSLRSPLFRWNKSSKSISSSFCTTFLSGEESVRVVPNPSPSICWLTGQYTHSDNQAWPKRTHKPRYFQQVRENSTWSPTPWISLAWKFSSANFKLRIYPMRCDK